MMPLGYLLILGSVTRQFLRISDHLSEFAQVLKLPAAYIKAFPFEEVSVLENPGPRSGSPNSNIFVSEIVTFATEKSVINDAVDARFTVQVQPDEDGKESMEVGSKRQKSRKRA